MAICWPARAAMNVPSWGLTMAWYIGSSSVLAVTVRCAAGMTRVVGPLRSGCRSPGGIALRLLVDVRKNRMRQTGNPPHEPMPKVDLVLGGMPNGILDRVVHVG